MTVTEDILIDFDGMVSSAVANAVKPQPAAKTTAYGECVE